MPDPSPSAPSDCTMCEEATATTTWGYPVCQPCADMLTMLDVDLKKMEAGDPALKVAGERVEEAHRRFIEDQERRRG